MTPYHVCTPDGILDRSLFACETELRDDRVEDDARVEDDVLGIALTQFDVAGVVGDCVDVRLAGHVARVRVLDRRELTFGVVRLQRGFRDSEENEVREVGRAPAEIGGIILIPIQ